MSVQMMVTFDDKSYSGAANYQTSTTNKDNYSRPFSKIYDLSSDGVETGKYDVLDVANWFLSKSPMSHLKLQKLCYYAQAWNYALNNSRLIDSDFQAWVHGPVSPVLYEKLKAFGYKNIRIKGNYKSKIDDADLEILESVWITYGNYAPSSLEALTHRELPWMEARIGYKPEERCRVVILPSTMKKYYLSVYNGENH